MKDLAIQRATGRAQPRGARDRNPGLCRARLRPAAPFGGSGMLIVLRRQRRPDTQPARSASQDTPYRGTIHACRIERDLEQCRTKPMTHKKVSGSRAMPFVR